MKKKISLLSILFLLGAWQTSVLAQQSSEKSFVVKGYCIVAPNSKGVDRFVKFINEELAPCGVNMLLCRLGNNLK